MDRIKYKLYCFLAVGSEFESRPDYQFYALQFNELQGFLSEGLKPLKG